jgi:hypothetical protein
VENPIMTEDRDFKRRVRARMEKTGEAYTTARLHLLARGDGALGVDNTDAGPHPAPTDQVPTRLSLAAAPTAPVPAAAPPPPPLLPPDHEALAGVVEGTLQAATGHGWDHWVRLLDDHGARTLPHGPIARHLVDVEGLDMWWAQTITVGYERIRGLRAPGQQRDGSWQVGRSRTFPVPAERLFQAFHDEGERRQWLGVEGLTLRSARPGKVVRLVWPDGSVAEVAFGPKGSDRSTVWVEHRKLPDGDRAGAMKAAWTEALDRLGAWLEEKRPAG